LLELQLDDDHNYLDEHHRFAQGTEPDRARKGSVTLAAPVQARLLELEYWQEVQEEFQGLHQQRRLELRRQQLEEEAHQAAAEGWQGRRADRLEPDVLVLAARRGADRGAELLHRFVPDPAVPVADLSGGGD